MTDSPALTPQTPQLVFHMRLEELSKHRNKRKRTTPGGKAAKGEDFWPMLDCWFDALREKLGDKWSTPEWKLRVVQFFIRTRF